MIKKAEFLDRFLTSSGLWPDNEVGTITPKLLRSGIYEFYIGDTQNWYPDNSGIIENDTDGLLGVNFDTLTSGYPDWKEGIVFYDEENKTIACYNDKSDVTLQLGQETHIRCVNKTGGTLANGTAVWINGAQGNRPTMEPSIADISYGSGYSEVVGLATHDIENNQEGLITINGTVGGLKTDTFEEGDQLYLSDTLSGVLTNSLPTLPNKVVSIGTVLTAHNNQGKIQLNINKTECITELCDVNGTSPESGYLLVNQGNYWDPSNKVNPSGGFFFGDVKNSNYSEFQPDTGFNRSYGDGMAWDDLRGPFNGAKLDVSGGKIDYNFDENTVDFQSNATASDVVCIILQMQHDWAKNTNVHPHLHWIQNQDVDPAWRINYRVYNNGDQVPAWNEGVPPSTLRKLTYTSGNMLQITEFPVLSGVDELSGFGVSWFMDIKIYRVGGDDSYSDAVAGKEFDLHYLRDDRGSRTEYHK